MFYFLFILGMVLVVYGVYKEKDNFLILVEEKQHKIQLNELNHLKNRIESIEKILFFSHDFETYLHESIDNFDQDSETWHEKEENTIPQNSLDKYEKILEYENQNYTLEEICSLLDMKKGEVLLLKNLYKTYKI